MDILTSLEFLEEGKEWPPPTQIDRLRKYAENRRRFNNKLDFDKKRYNKIASLLGDHIRVIEYRILINFFKKVSLKTSDLLFVEPPIVSAGDDKKKNETITTIIDTSDLGNIGAQAAIDASRYGDSLLRIIAPGEDENGDQKTAYIGITSPSLWFPVSDPMDIKKITHHVIAWTSTKIITENGKDKKITYLDYQIHNKGNYVRGRKVVDDDGLIGLPELVIEPKPVASDIEAGVIGDAVRMDNGQETEEVDTGLSDFAIVPAQNVVTSDTIFAIDDYDDFANIVDELQIRVEQNAHILDRHADPSLAGPESALTLDEATGEKYFKMGGFFNVGSKDDPDIKYVTWDGKLDSSFKQIELYFDLIAVLSEMGAAIFDRDTLKGASLSGRALRLLYVNPLTKVRRIRNRFDRSIKQAVSLASEVGFDGAIEMSDISIKWNDGLPNDAKELAEIGAIRTAGKPTDTQVAQIVEQDGVTQEDAEAKQKQIVKETNDRLMQTETPPFFEEEGDEDEDEA